MKLQKEIAQVIKELKPGQKIYTRVSTVSRSGMSRRVRAYIVKDGEIRDITGPVARAIDLILNNDGMYIGGCGFDAGFEVVYSLGRVLFKDGGPCTGDDSCTSNDHSNGDRIYTKGKIHKDGGYTFKHETLA